MSKTIIAGLTALFIAGTAPGYAQQLSAVGPGVDLPSAADLKALTDWRIDLVKAALQLTPAQAKHWPAVEDAIRARANARHARLAKWAAQASEPRERSPIELLRERADGMAQRAAALKKLVDAWQPLYESLDTAQNQRLRFLTVYVLREMRNAVESRRFQSEEEYEED
jgi:LTXXQ motif family protein